MNTPAHTTRLLALVAASALFTSSAFAQLVVKPISVATTLISNGAVNTETSSNFEAVNLINNSGLSLAINTGDAIPSTPTTITASGDVPTNWLSSAGSYNDSRLTFDLGAHADMRYAIVSTADLTA